MNEIVRDLIQDKKNDELLQILNITNNENCNNLKNIMEYSIHCDNYELVKILWFNYNVRINIYKIMEELCKNPYNNFLKYCLKNKIVKKKSIYICEDVSYMNGINYTQMHYIMPGNFKIYIFNGEKILDRNIVYRDFIELFYKFLFSNSYLIFTNLKNFESFFHKFSYYVELKYCYTYKECLSNIDKENFKEFLKTSLDKERFNVVFFNLKYYIESFL